MHAHRTIIILGSMRKQVGERLRLLKQENFCRLSLKFFASERHNGLRGDARMAYPGRAVESKSYQGYPQILVWVSQASSVNESSILHTSAGKRAAQWF